MITYKDFMEWKDVEFPYGSGMDKVIIYVLPLVLDYIKSSAKDRKQGVKVSITMIAGMILFAKSPYHARNMVIELQKHLNPTDMFEIYKNASFLAKAANSIIEDYQSDA